VILVHQRPKLCDRAAFHGSACILGDASDLIEDVIVTIGLGLVGGADIVNSD
jgi:hypothetical protein